MVSERCAKTREIRASRNSSSRNVARFSIEILDPRERDLRKFSLPIHLFANAKLKKEKERERKKRKGEKRCANRCMCHFLLVNLRTTITMF